MLTTIRRRAFLALGLKSICSVRDRVFGTRPNAGRRQGSEPLSLPVLLLLGTGARLHLTDVGFVVGILDDDFRCAENSRLRYRVVQGRQPELISAPVPLHHLHAPNPERRVLRGLALNACDGKVLSIHRSEERRVGKECRSRWSP